MRTCDGLRIEAVAALQVLDRLHHALMRHVRGVGLVRSRLDDPLRSEPVGQPGDVGRLGEGVEIAVAALDHGDGTVQPLRRQQRAFQPHRARAAQVDALGVVARPGELEQACRARARQPQRRGHRLGAEAEELADRGGRAERTLHAGIVEAARGFEADGAAVEAARELEAQCQGEQEILAAAMVALADCERRRKDRAGCVRAGERLAFEGADQRAVGERRTRDVGAPRLIDDRDLGSAAELAHHLDDPPRPGQRRAHECGRQRIEQRDLELGDETGGQVLVARLGDETGEYAGGLPASIGVHRAYASGVRTTLPATLRSVSALSASAARSSG